MQRVAKRDWHPRHQAQFHILQILVQGVVEQCVTLKQQSSSLDICTSFVHTGFSQQAVTHPPRWGRGDVGHLQIVFPAREVQGGARAAFHLPGLAQGKLEVLTCHRVEHLEALELLEFERPHLTALGQKEADPRPLEVILVLEFHPQHLGLESLGGGVHPYPLSAQSAEQPGQAALTGKLERRF